jgi:hypothetical protein
VGTSTLLRELRDQERDRRIGRARSSGAGRGAERNPLRSQLRSSILQSVKHVWFGQKAVFLGDDAADALVSYAAHVAQVRTGDSVDMRGINTEGNEVVTTFLLNTGTTLTAETTNLDLPVPDNSAAIEYIRGRIAMFSLNEGFFEGFRVEGDEPADTVDPR